MASTRKKVSPRQDQNKRIGPNEDKPNQARSDRSVAVVTGGAGSIGTIICLALAREGIRVVVGYNRSAEKANALAARLPGGGHVALAAPVTDSARLGQAF